MRLTLDAGLYDAVVFDLDGVVTDTAAAHAAAWRDLFDDYLRRRPPHPGEDHRPFSDEDYLRFVDGRPRYDGVSAFLESRGITLPRGHDSDSTDAETVRGLGNRKDGLFLERLARVGATAFDTTVALVRRLRSAGVATAVFSASRNCRAVLEAAGIGDLFPVRVDGVVAAQLGLPGKPDPAMPLEAAARLGASPAHAVVVEDAEAGVEAGRRGGFAKVIGVDRSGHADSLLRRGADIVVADLGEVAVRDRARRLADLPDALEAWEAVAGILDRRPWAVFLDFDGTMSAIADDPAAAFLTEGMDRALLRLAERFPVAVVSGRDLRDVRERTGLAQLWYAGSHGFEIAGPDGTEHEHPAARGALGPLAEASEALTRDLADVDGVVIEPKRFALAVHHRKVDPARAPDVVAAVRAAGERARLRVTSGRKVTELRPDLDWDKGSAVRWLMESIPGAAGAAPFYAGDDLTDEDALAVVRSSGLGVAVRGPGRDDRPSEAHVAVDGPGSLRLLLGRLADLTPASEVTAP